MSDRRQFLKKLGKITTTGMALSWGSPAFASKAYFNAVFESSYKSPDFWKIVEGAFHIDSDLIYLNNGTIGPSPAVVEEAVVEHIHRVNSTLKYGGGEGVRAEIAEFINADKTEISITHNTTEGLNVAAWGLPLKAGDEIIISSQEHVGNAMPWLNRASQDGVKVKTFHPASTQAGILNQINDLITRRTKVISVPHVSCTIGQRFPVKEICALAKEKNIFSVIDGAHGAGALKLDMQDLQPDFYATCGHKWLLGPKGTGFFYIKKELLDIVKPVFAGAYSDKGFDITVNPPVFEGYSPTAHRYDYGTQNAALRVGLSAAIGFHAKLGADVIDERVTALNEYLYARLHELNQIDILSSPEKSSRSMMVGFRHKKIDFMDLFQDLLRERIRVRAVPESGLNSLRVSTHIYNNEEQIDRLIESLKRLED